MIPGRTIDGMPRSGRERSTDGGAPDPDSRVRIAGRNYRWRDLSRGQELDVWLPPDRWEIVVPEDPEAQFAAAPTVASFVISEPAPTVAANTLPRTASPLPLIGAAGGVLVVLGLVVAGIRRRFFSAN